MPEERCSIIDDESESVKAACESRKRWNLERAAVVRLAEASREASSVRLKLLRSFFSVKNFKKSEMLSSSVCRDPELPSSPSANKPEFGWLEEFKLAFPLLLSSSVLFVLLPPPDENLDLRWPKLLL